MLSTNPSPIWLYETSEPPLSAPWTKEAFYSIFQSEIYFTPTLRLAFSLVPKFTVIYGTSQIYFIQPDALSAENPHLSFVIWPEEPFTCAVRVIMSPCLTLGRIH